jgi:hypothetical protein
MCCTPCWRDPTGFPSARAWRISWTAALGNNHAILALEWSRVAAPLLLLVFLSALCHLLRYRGSHALAQTALWLGVLSTAFSIFANTFNCTLNHALGEAYVNAGSAAEQAAILAVFESLGAWHRGINQAASLLYQGCVALFGIALLRLRMWRLWGALGLAGACIALIAKLTPGLQGITNFAWTGLAYCFWPVALGIGLMRIRSDGPQQEPHREGPAIEPPSP